MYSTVEAAENDNRLPFLRPQSSAFKQKRQQRKSSATTTTSARTAATQAMNLNKSANKVQKDHDESLVRQQRSYLLPSGSGMNVSSSYSSSSFNSAQRQHQQQQQTPIPAPPPPSHSSSSSSSSASVRNDNVKKKHNSNNSENVMRDDSAHLWWPKQFDGLAYIGHLERLIEGQEKSNPDRTDVKNALSSLELVVNTLHGTPAAQLLTEVRKVLSSVIFRPSSSSSSSSSSNNNKSNNNNNKSRKESMTMSQGSEQLDHDNNEDDDDRNNNNNEILLRDLVFGLELEVDQLRTELYKTKSDFEQLRESTAKQVREANSKKVISDLTPALESTQVTEKTILKVQKESAEMATRLQESLAQQQVVRAKLVDLGIRNVELRHVLEAQKRAATARSWEDSIPSTTATSVLGSSSSLNDNSPTASLDRSALHILGDVVASSQTELANLIEYRQRLSSVVLGDSNSAASAT